MLLLSFAAVNACGREFCASLCLLRGRHGYTCACPAGQTLHVNRHRCTGQTFIPSLQFSNLLKKLLKYLDLDGVIHSYVSKIRGVHPPSPFFFFLPFFRFPWVAPLEAN